MLNVILLLLNLAFTAPLCTVKVDSETLKGNQVVKNHKFKDLSVKECKRRATKISSSPARVNERFKFVSWEWRNRTTVKK